MTVNCATNRWGVANIIVAPTIAEGAMFTSIASAVTYAEANNIYDIAIKPGQYTENFTVSENINFFAMPGLEENASVRIIGKISQSAAATPTYKDIRFQTNGDVILEFTGSGLQQTQFTDCIFELTDADMMTINNANSNPFFDRCDLRQNATNLDFYNITSCNTVTFQNCGTTISSGTKGTSNIASGLVRHRYSRMSGNLYSNSATGNIQSVFCIYDNSLTNNTPITTSGTNGNNVLRHCMLLSGSAVAVSIGAGTAVTVEGITVNSTNANPIDGSGTLIGSPIQFSSSGKNIGSSLTTTLYSMRAGEVNVDNLRLDGNTFSSQNTNGDINLEPNGSGKIVSSGLTGILASNGASGISARTLQQPAAGITISNADGTAGDPTLALANDLSALEALASTGIAARTASDTWAQRTITGTSNEITLTNGNGVSGNPTISLVTGTFTPTITTSGGGDTKNYSTQEGWYVRLGNMVYIYANIGYNTFSGGSGEVRINVPFAADAFRFCGSIRTSAFTSTTTPRMFQTTTSSTSCKVISTNSADDRDTIGTIITVGSLSASGAITYWGMYIT